MTTERTILADMAKLENSAEEFVLGSLATDPNDFRANIDSRPLLPYVTLALGMILLGAGFWICASIAFTFYIILNATTFDKAWQQGSLLPQELRID